jgi:hypothetical protein
MMRAVSALLLALATVLTLPILTSCLPILGEQAKSAGASHLPRAVIPAPSIAFDGGKIYADIWILDGKEQPEAHLAAFLRGPGAPAGSRQLRCMPSSYALHCEGLQPDDTGLLDHFWPRQGTGWALGSDAREGRYTIEVTFDGQRIGSTDVDLVRMPSLAGETVLIPDPAPRAGQLWRMPDNFVAWLPIDRRFTQRQLTAVWFHNDEFAAEESTVLHGPPEDGPVFDVRPVQIRLPDDMRRHQYKHAPDAAGRWRLFVFADAKKLLGEWELTLGYGAPQGVDLVVPGWSEWTFWGRVLPASARPELRAAAKGTLQRDASISGPGEQPLVCALALEHSARDWLATNEKLRKAWWANSGSVAASYETAVDDTKYHAALQGRDPTQAEFDAAGRKGDAGSRGARARVDRVEEAEQAHSAKLAAIAKKYKAKCLADIVPVSVKPLVED